MLRTWMRAMTTRMGAPTAAMLASTIASIRSSYRKRSGPTGSNSTTTTPFNSAGTQAQRPLLRSAGGALLSRYAAPQRPSPLIDHPPSPPVLVKSRL